MKKTWKTGVLAAVMAALLALAGCAYFQNVQERWNALTPDEQARVVIGGLQKQLNTKFDEAKLFCAAKPELGNYWKQKLVPAFDTCNKSLAKMRGLAEAGKITPDQVYITFKPELDRLILYLIEIGMKW